MLRTTFLPIALLCAFPATASAMTIVRATPARAKHAPQHRLKQYEARDATRITAGRVADLFVNDRPRVRTDCHRLAKFNFLCETAVTAPGLSLRFNSYVGLSDEETVTVYYRRVQILRQPLTPFP